MVRYKGDLDDG